MLLIISSHWYLSNAQDHLTAAWAVTKLCNFTIGIDYGKTNLVTVISTDCYNSWNTPTGHDSGWFWLCVGMKKMSSSVIWNNRNLTTTLYFGITINDILKYNVKSNFRHQFPLYSASPFFFFWSQLPIHKDIVITSLVSHEDANMSWNSSLLIQKMLM